MILIVDCGSQFTQNIARIIRELGVYTEVVPYTISMTEILAFDVDGIIISGGPGNVHVDGHPDVPHELNEINIPILGICYGMQLMAKNMGGVVCSGDSTEYGKTTVHVLIDSPLFGGIRLDYITTWMSHNDFVKTVPPGFHVIAKSINGVCAAAHNLSTNRYMLQFHPEVSHTQYGEKILDNFIKICGANRSWHVEQMFDDMLGALDNTIGGKVGIGGVSGGIDSLAASLVLQYVDTSFNPIFIDNGLLRKNEVNEVRYILQHAGVQNVRYVDAAREFLDDIKGISDPELKREKIGYRFIDVFNKTAEDISGVSYLMQGTLYPDVIESIPSIGGSSVIKKHHNVGCLPENMELVIVEPFRKLFKDEVRKLAKEILLIPDELVNRHPFPGPGLAIRIIGAVTREKLEVLREADDILINIIKELGLYNEISQAFVVHCGIASTGVVGDVGMHGHVVAVRAVTSTDFMTADWYEFKRCDLEAISSSITNGVKDVCRVVYDITQKPPATIEWE